VRIAQNIARTQQNTLLGANNIVAAELPSSAIIAASNDSFIAYHYTTYNIIRLLPELVDFLVVIHVATEKSWVITQIFLFGTGVILLILKMMDEKMEKLTKEMVRIAQQTRIKISKSWTDLFVWWRCPYDERPADPADLLPDTIFQWYAKDRCVKDSHLTTNLMQGCLSLFCLLFIEKPAILIWLILNHSRLWKGVHLWRRLTEIVIHNQAKMAIHLANHDKSRKAPKPMAPKVDLNGVIIIKGIDVVQPECPSIRLSDTLIINPNDRIIIEGSKGAGKSYLISIMTGMVDVVSDMLIGGTKVEFANLRFWVIFQNIASLYLENPIKTIAHSLNDLFPDATLSELVPFLKVFGLEGIIPKGSNPLETPLGKNESSLSPGTVRTIVLASRMWKLQKLLDAGEVIHAVIMDEADTAIDYETVEKFYELINELLKKYGVPLIVISHSRDFRELVQKMAEKRCKVLTATKEGDVITYQQK
jgi:ABC-type multidrug transport system fused ATPase/permease subunit